MNVVAFLFCHPEAVYLFGNKQQVQGEGDWENWKKKRLSWLCMDLGKFRNWKPLVNSESHWKGLLALLEWEEKRERATEQVAMSVFVNRGHPEQSKCSVTHWRLLFPWDRHRAMCSEFTVRLSLGIRFIHGHVLRRFVPCWSQIF